MMGQSETLRICRVTFITLFRTGALRYCAIYQAAQTVQVC